MSGRHSIAVLLVGLNVGRYGYRSIAAVQSAIAELEDLNIRLLAVDDGSSDGTLEYMVQACKDFADAVTDLEWQVLSHDNRMGFTSSIRTGLASLSESADELISVLVLPANDQLEPESIRNLILMCSATNVVLGYRINKRQSRPPVKWLTSTLLQMLTRVMLFPDLRDLTGQYIAPLRMFREALAFDGGHAWPVYLVHECLVENVNVVQVPIRLKPEFRSRSTEDGFRQFPRLRDIKDYLNGMLQIWVDMKRDPKLRNRKTRLLGGHETSAP